MNKRCTDSSCRRTFSILDFDGKCPHCGKPYPQLGPARHRALPQAHCAARKKKRRICLCVTSARRSFRLWISLDEILKYVEAGKMDEAVRAFWKEVIRYGYGVGRDDAGKFCEDIRGVKPLHTRWYLLDEEEDDFLGKRIGLAAAAPGPGSMGCLPDSQDTGRTGERPSTVEDDLELDELELDDLFDDPIFEE